MDSAFIDRFKQSEDFKHEELDNGKFTIQIMYFDSLCDAKTIKQEIVHPFLLSPTPESFMEVLDAALSCTALQKDDDPANTLLNRCALVKLEDRYYQLKAPKPAKDQPTEAVAETTLQGPQSAFSEDVDANLSVIRERYPSPDIVVEEYKLGTVTKTTSYVIYDSSKVDENVLSQFKERLKTIDAEVVQSVGQLEALLTGRKISWLPTILITERPDRTVLNLAQGKIALILSGSPYILILPTVFFDFISAMDDFYQTFIVTRVVILLRYVGLIITVTLPALYVAIVSYNPEIFKVQFALSIAGSRSSVPFPSFIEVIFMLFIIEALVEASLRLPNYIGATATTVGGLILGQAAQMAGLVSSVMIIIASVVAISNFLIPINAMSFALRFAKYPLVLLASFFGIVGIVGGVFAFLIYIADQHSYGTPYLKMYNAEQNVMGYKRRKGAASD